MKIIIQLHRKISTTEGRVIQPLGLSNRPLGWVDEPKDKITLPQGWMNEPLGRVDEPQGRIILPWG